MQYTVLLHRKCYGFIPRIIDNSIWNDYENEDNENWKS